MTEHQIAELMRRGTAGVRPPDLAATALVRARRVRRRRRALGAAGVSAGVAAAVVATVVGGSALTRGAPAPDRPGPAGHGTGHAAGPVTEVMPRLSERILGTPLDPAAVGRLPVASLGLPADLTPPAGATRTAAGTALLVTKERGGDPQEFFALGTDHAWHRMRVASGHDTVGGLGPMLTRSGLSPDGRRVAFRGTGAAYVVDLGTGLTRRFAMPGVVDLLWQGDGRHLLMATDRGAGRLVDAVTGRAERVPLGPQAFGGAPPTAYDGRTLVHLVGIPHGGGTALVEESGGAVVHRATRTASRSYDLGDLLAAPGRLAMTATPYVGPDQTSHGAGTGILVLHRPSYAGAAYLRVTGPSGDYGTGDALLARAWVTPDVLLLSVTPETTHGGTVERPVQDYLTWDVRTGELRRVASAPAAWRDSSWATDLLAGSR